MARTSGFKMTKDLHNFLRVAETPILEHTDEATLIFELRAITGKYQPLAGIQHDLAEIALIEQQQDQEQEAANDNETEAA